MSNTHIEDVRRELLATLRDLRNRQNPMELDRAKAVAAVASVLVDTARVENEFLRLTESDQSTFLGPNTETTLLPKGITGVTMHRLIG